MFTSLHVITFTTTSQERTPTAKPTPTFLFLMSAVDQLLLTLRYEPEFDLKRVLIH